MDRRGLDAANEYNVPDWAPHYLRYEGRPKYDSEKDRNARWLEMRRPGAVNAAERADRAMAMSFQEPYLRQVRAVLADFDAFLQSERTREQRRDWAESTRLWIFDRLTRSRLTRSTTAIGWLMMLAPRLPVPLPRRSFMAILRSLAQASMLRPPQRLRGLWAEAKAAAEDKGLQRSRRGKEIWAAIMAMRSGVRRPDACRIVAGQADDQDIVGETVVVFPRTEKTDMFGHREIEPIVITCASEQESSKLFAILTSPSPSSDPIALEKSVADQLHRFGVRDIRAIRRDAAERCGSREKAAIMLRHRPGSAHTLRYATTRDRIEPLRLIGRRIHRPDG